jgi:hypothetical protein
MDKRGEWTLLQTITIIGGILAASILMSIVLRYSSKDNVQFTFFAIDSAMLSDAMLAAPQNVRVVYPTGDGFVRLDEDSISFFGSKPLYGQSSKFRSVFVPCKEPMTIRADSGGKVFFLIKEKDSFTISNNPSAIDVTELNKGEESEDKKPEEEKKDDAEKTQ